VVSLTTGKDLPANERGELLYRGPQVMMGYAENPEATSEIMTKTGFLRTGDVGFIDEDGFVFVVDRAKELIKYKGHGVAPAELEDVLNHHPDVVDSCCVRGQDAKGEEIPKAFVVLKRPNDPSAPTHDEIMAFVAERVAPYKKVRQVQFIDAIPKNASGKLLRRKLQELEAHAQAVGVAA
jgi:4-coumarate--CoA ligase